MTTKQQPRGIRNNNPGNIRRTGDWTKWQGLAAPDKQNDSAFIAFATPAWGIRALARTLVTYRDKYDLTTIRGIISRWAPPHENNTKAYVSVVANAVGVDPDDHIDVADFDTAMKLVPAIIKHENGVQPYPEDVLRAGLKLAGIVPRGAAAAAMKQPETKVAAVVGAGTVATGGAGVYVAVQVHETVQAMNQVGRARLEAGDAQAGLTYLGGGLALMLAGAIALGYLAWRKARIRKE